MVHDAPSSQARRVVSAMPLRYATESATCYTRRAAPACHRTRGASAHPSYPQPPGVGATLPVVPPDRHSAVERSSKAAHSGRATTEGAPGSHFVRQAGHADPRRRMTSADKADNEPFLLPGLDSVRAVALTDPVDGIARRKSTQDCEAGQGRSGSSVASETTQLNLLSTASAFEQRSQGGNYWSGITGHAEIGPIEVIVGPRWIPLRVEIQTEVGILITGIGIPGVKRNGGDLGSMRQHDDVSVQVHVKSPMIVARGGAFRRFFVHVPVDLALCAHDYRSSLNHASILASRIHRPRQGRCGAPHRQEG